MKSSSRSVVIRRAAVLMIAVALAGAVMLEGCAAGSSNPASTGGAGASTTQPSTAPAQISQLDGILKQAQSFVTILGGTLETAATAAQDPVVRAAAAVIPYGSLALAVLGIAAAVVKHTQATALASQQSQTQKALTQVVSAMDAVVPSPTPEQQSKIAAVLDSDVKATVAATRAG